MSTTYIVNANTLSVSTYDIDVLGVVSHGDELLFVEALQLTKRAAVGTTIDFSAIVETGDLDLGADEKKYIPRIKAAVSGDATTEVWVTIDLDGDSIEMGPYELPGRSGSSSFVRPWRFSNGFKADSVSLKFEGSEGTTWGLDGLIVSAELV